MKAGSVVLLHSPLVTATTWGRLPDELRTHGLHVVVPAVRADDDPPYAARYVAHAAQQLEAAGLRTPLVLVGHSGAGPLLPQVGASQRAARRRIGAYVFLDAGLPRAGADRLDLLAVEDAGMAAAFRAELAAGARFPSWTETDLAADLPDAADRRTVVTGMRPRGLDFFTERLPHPDDWPDAPCGYLRTSDAYVVWARLADLRGWTVATHRAGHLRGHFAALSDPLGLATALADIVTRL